MRRSYRAQNTVSRLQRRCTEAWPNIEKKTSEPRSRAHKNQSSETEFRAANELADRHQTAWHKRPIGNLPFKSRSPSAGDSISAIRAAAIRRQPVLFDKIAISLNQQTTAVRAIRIFECADSSRQVPRINKFKASLLPNFSCTVKVLRFGILRVGHLVILVESRYVPGNIRRDARQKLCQLPEFIVGIIEPRNEQRNDLDPDSHFVQTADGIEDRGDSASELPIMAIVKALK